MLYYVSFCDPEKPQGQQFLGACIVEATGELEVCPEAARQGCNPGGEAVMMPVPAERFEQARRWMNRLLSREDIDTIDREAAQ